MRYNHNVLTQLRPDFGPIWLYLMPLDKTLLLCQCYSFSPTTGLELRNDNPDVCVNPLIYVTEGFHAALTTAPHMPLYVIYTVLIALCALFLWAG